MTWWWLSFADGKRPRGDQFLGACLVQASDGIDAVRTTHRMGLNPGGEVLFLPVESAKVDRVPERYRNRLLTRAECEQMDREALS